MGGIVISENYLNDTMKLMIELEKMEKEECRLPLVFTEVFKDEINANDEEKLFNGVKRIVKKYSENNEVTSAINEFTSVISGGASLKEILQITRDEILNPTLSTDLTVDKECELH